MRLHAPGTFITDPLFYIPQKEKIAPNIVARIVRVNGPLLYLLLFISMYLCRFFQSDDTKHSSNGFMTNFLSVLQTLCQKVTLDKVGWSH